MNIYDIAKEAGVSITTVSRVLNGKRNVNSETRRKVEAILAKHNYVPSAIAQGMVSKSMRTVAVLMVDVRIPHYARAAHVIESECAHRGYNVLMCNTGDVHSDSMRYLEILSRRQVDGIIMIGSIYSELVDSPTISNLMQLIPCVVANGKLPGSFSVMVDDFAGISSVVEYLIQKGHTKIAYVKNEDTESSYRKVSGYQTILRRNDLEPYILECENSLEGGMECALRFLENSNNCTAIVCGDDLIAAGIVKAFAQKDIRVPDDIAVTGYGDSLYARICEPSLTTVDSRPELMGLMSAQLLSSLMDNQKERCASITLQPALIVGKST